ncbi:MAG: zinc-binding dehydrogenase [Planctomycetota bacterium]|nr:zinc-binding dehydrogenase [Planctomycetota bacterium]
MPSNPTVLFTGPAKVEVEDRPIPEPAHGQVRVRTLASLISTGTELTVLAGEADAKSVWGQITRFPFVPGYNNVGVITAAGPGADASLVGKRVGSYAPHTLHHVHKPEDLRPIPDGVADEQAVFFTTAEIVMNGVRRSRLLWGESAVVFGLGLLGQLTARVCRIAGASPVIGVDVAPSRLRLLERIPGAGVIGVDARAGDVAEAVARATRGRKADVAFELTGNGAAIPGEVASLRLQGRLVILSSPRSASEFDFHDLCNAPSITIIGAHNFSHPMHATPDNPWTFARDAELFFDWVAAGEMDMSPLISHRGSPADAPGLYGMLLQDRTQAMGVVLRWDGA